MIGCIYNRIRQGTPREHFVKLFVTDFYRQILKATEITDKMLHETLPWHIRDLSLSDT